MPRGQGLTRLGSYLVEIDRVRLQALEAGSQGVQHGAAPQTKASAHQCICPRHCTPREHEDEGSSTLVRRSIVSRGGCSHQAAGIWAQ